MDAEKIGHPGVGQGAPIANSTNAAKQNILTLYLVCD
jgi:hypothetical protein